MMDYTLGVDISKVHPDVFDLEEVRAARFENTRAGLARLQRWLGFRLLARVVHEPTRSCNRLFEAGLTGHLPLCQGNPLQARRVALACGGGRRRVRWMRACRRGWARRLTLCPMLRSLRRSCCARTRPAPQPPK